MKITRSIRKAADLDTVIPGLAAVWKAIKAETRTSKRVPQTVTVTDEAWSMLLNDGESGRRFGLSLRSMELSDRALHVSSGEAACHAGSNNDQAIDGIPDGFALIDCTWHDYYKTFSIVIQVSKGAVAPEPAALAA